MDRLSVDDDRVHPILYPCHTTASGLSEFNHAFIIWLLWQKAWDREERERQKELESQERLILKAIEAEASQFDSIAEARKRKRREEAEKEKEVTRAERARRRNGTYFLLISHLEVE